MSHSCRATQEGWVLVESSDKTWSTEGGNDKPLQYSCFENPKNRKKSKKNNLMIPSTHINLQAKRKWKAESLVSELKWKKTFISVLRHRKIP